MTEQDMHTDENADDHPWGSWPKPLVDGYHVPESIKDFETWVLWSPDFGKTPMAPWVTGHMYPAAWGEGIVDDPEVEQDERPETTYDKAKMIAEMGPETIHSNYSFPPLDGADEPHIPDKVTPTILLPHDPPEPPIMQVDFDDVRDPETGAISPEVVEIIKRLDSYTEVSQSGEGVHVFVRAALPGGLGKYIAALDTVGEIEMYDHGRFVGATWEHIGGTPTEVGERQDVVDELVKEYETETLRDRRQRDATAGEGASPAARNAAAELDAIRDDFDLDEVDGDGADDGGAGGDSRRNAYYQALDVEKVAREGRYGIQYFNYRDGGARREWKNGPHPGHGPMKSDISECTNFGIKDNGWSCFAHEGGQGGALALLAVVKGVVDCDRAERVHENPAALLKTCLHARDLAPKLDDADPPYKALVGVAEQFDLAMKDPEKGILGESRDIARQIYDEMDPADAEGI